MTVSSSSQPSLAQRAGGILFWTWNAVFIAFMFLGFAPNILPQLIENARRGTTPLVYVVFGVLITLAPLASVVLGLTHLRGEPVRLFALGYVVEGPLMMLLIFRFFAVREVTAMIAALLVLIGAGILAFLWDLLDHHPSRRTDAWGALRLAGLTLMAAAALYASLWLLFYVPPVARGIVDLMSEFGRLLQSFATDTWKAITEEGRLIPFYFLGFILAIFTGSLLAVLPAAVPVLTIRAWLRQARTLAATWGWSRVVVTCLLTLALAFSACILSDRQPQLKAFALLENPPTSPEEAQRLLDQGDLLRNGLVNAYLAPFRYLSAMGEVSHVSQIYAHYIGLSERTAIAIQHIYEQVARPLLYVPVHAPPQWRVIDNQAFSVEPREAAVLYERFFDEKINVAEKKAVVKAVRSTWLGDQAEAAWQAVDDREVYLEHQEVSIAEHGEWAEVEIHEVYRNQTNTRQEVVYYFSLPESAAVTGLWLGNSDDRDARYAYRVSPRGAAQAAYQNEIRHNVDPALVEQIGPRQYRLRIFPVEPASTPWDVQSNRLRTVHEAPPLHLWLTYQVMAVHGAWPMPQLAERRNVFWNDKTQRLLNGQPVSLNDQVWLPETAAALAPAPGGGEHRFAFPGGAVVLAHPLGEASFALQEGLRLAVVLDRSRSMAQQASLVQDALARLAQAVGGAENLDVYLTSSPYRGENPSRVKLAELDPERVLYFGGQNAAELLTQFQELSRGEKYDAVIVLTDGNGYELGQEGVRVKVPESALWVVHVNGRFPLGYDDPTLEAIQASGGGIAGSLEEALMRIAARSAAQQISAEVGLPGAQVDVIDGYAWIVQPGSLKIFNQKNDAETKPARPIGDLTPLAARRLVLAKSAVNRATLGRLDTLDALHGVAKNYGVVTPFSSMIVLVNATQKLRLNSLESRPDRFTREVEDFGETSETPPPTVTGVPEPEEWLLIGLALAALGFVAFTRKR